jgi:hypothetical protein
MDWPAEGAALYRNFGWNNGGRPLLGHIFEGTGPVKSAEPGELLFSSRGGNLAGGGPSPLGSWTALDHGEGIISFYSRVGVGPPRELPLTMGAAYPLGAMGQSGCSETGGLYFSLFDRRERRWVNPSMLIRAPEDTRPPQILTVRLQNDEGVFLDPAQTRSLGQGRYRVSVAATDTLMDPGEHPLAPHRIICSVNGGEIGSLSFEIFSARDGVLLVNRNGLVPVRQVYAPFPAYEAGELWLTRGQANLEIIAQDITGNTRSVVYRLVVE